MGDVQEVEEMANERIFPVKWKPILIIHRDRSRRGYLFYGMC